MKSASVARRDCVSEASLDSLSAQRKARWRRSAQLEPKSSAPLSHMLERRQTSAWYTICPENEPMSIILQIWPMRSVDGALANAISLLCCCGSLPRAAHTSHSKLRHMLHRRAPFRHNSKILYDADSHASASCL